MDDGCLDMSKAFHVGCRGSVISKDVLIEDKEQGWTTIDLDMFVDIGPVEAARRVKEQIGKPCYSLNPIGPLVLGDLIWTRNVL